MAWLDQNNTPLTYEEHRIIDDTNFSIKRNKYNEWTLEIKDVKYEYQGQYRCTINTQPEAKYKTVMLQVKGESMIGDSEASTLHNLVEA